MCWCTKHYVSHTIRERFFSPLVESEPLCDSNVRLHAAWEWATATTTTTTAATTTANLYGSESCEREPDLFLIQWELDVNWINSLGGTYGRPLNFLFPFFKHSFFWHNGWLHLPPLFFLMSSLTYSLESEETEITASQELTRTSRLALRR